MPTDSRRGRRVEPLVSTADVSNSTPLRNSKKQGIDKCTNLEELSLVELGLQTLEGFPMLPNLVLLILSDNFISGGLDALAELPSLEELNLSNNKIASLDDLKPLAPMGLISLDLYQCPIVKNVGVNYREEVFKLLPGLKFLDNYDKNNVERNLDDEENDDDEEQDDYEDEDEDEDDERVAVTTQDEDDEDDEDDNEDDDDEEDDEEGEEDDDFVQLDDDDEEDEDDANGEKFVGEDFDDEDDEEEDIRAAGGEDELADIDDMDFPEADEDEGEEYGTERLVGELANDDDDDEGFEPIDENPESEDIDEEDDESGPSALKRKRGFEDDDDLDDEDDDDDE